MSANNLAFFQLKRRMTNLELQHNTLTSICMVLAKRLKELESNVVHQHPQVKTLINKTKSGKPSKVEVREINLKQKSHRSKSKKKVKYVEPETESEESESEPEPEPESDSEASESEEVVQEKPKKSKKPAKPIQEEVKPVQEEVKPVKKRGRKLGSKNKNKLEQHEEVNKTIEILDSVN